MLQRGDRRTRRVSAISDYLESFRKGKMPGVALCEKGREKGNGEREREEEESELWIAGGTGNNSSNCKRFPSEPAHGRLILSNVCLATFKMIQRLLLRLA